MSNNTFTSNSHQIPPNYGLSIGDVTNGSVIVRQEYKDGWVNSYNKDGYLIGTARPIDYTPPTGNSGEIDRPEGLTLLDTLDKITSSLLKDNLTFIKKNPEHISLLNNKALWGISNIIFPISNKLGTTLILWAENNKGNHNKIYNRLKENPGNGEIIRGLLATSDLSEHDNIMYTTVDFGALSRYKLINLKTPYIVTTLPVGLVTDVAPEQIRGQKSTSVKIVAQGVIDTSEQKHTTAIIPVNNLNIPVIKAQRIGNTNKYTVPIIPGIAPVRFELLPPEKGKKTATDPILSPVNQPFLPQPDSAKTYHAFIDFGEHNQLHYISITPMQIKGVKDYIKQNEKTPEINRETDDIKDAVKFTADFYQSVFKAYGEKAEQLAKALAEQARGKNIRNIEDALKAYEKHKENINKKINAKDRKAIATALESVKVADIAENFKRFSKGMGYTSKFIDAADWLNELKKALETGNWRPFFVKTETIAAGSAATVVVAFAFSILLGNPVGLIGYGLIMAIAGYLINDEMVEKANQFWGI